ncbi:hypothetical protein ADU59_20290 [Pararhizobium polonicum]|uniref:Uncharacterized protein n=1 Tax=Pararhizobium polonicum TaxID=1612624 RepID=A0A1C7NX41_9HYPH|nr:hypothetical protein ADU59_20290 [Pararhizobium polonicum]
MGADCRSMEVDRFIFVMKNKDLALGGNQCARTSQTACNFKIAEIACQGKMFFIDKRSNCLRLAARSEEN